MSKIRVHQLAKELSAESKEVVAKALELGIDVKNHMSSLDDEQAAAVRTALGGEPSEEPASPQAPSVSEGARQQDVPEEDPDGQVAMEAKAAKRAGQRGRGGKRGGLAQDDPFWQFGTPVESWGNSRGGPKQDGQTQPVDSSGLAPDDPYWTFGSPVSSWGSTKKKKEGRPQDRSQRKRSYIECRTCGVKIEKKRAHYGKKVPCPFCNKWMRDVR